VACCLDETSSYVLPRELFALNILHYFMKHGCHRERYLPIEARLHPFQLMISHDPEDRSWMITAVVPPAQSLGPSQNYIRRSKLVNGRS
jgi:hypothetical protein